MNTFSQEKIEEYYDKTEVHYARAWDLRESLAMHYGYWDDSVSSFRESLANMNRKMAEFGNIKSTDRVLDAGCGVGGSSIFLAKEYGCQVTGITLSAKQAETATKNAQENGVSHLVNFRQADFRNTPFEAETFDVIWGLESTVHDHNKYGLLKEAKRILKKNGRLVLAEYLKPRKLTDKENKIVLNWLNAQAMADITDKEHFNEAVANTGFKNIHFEDITSFIKKSSWRMYYGSFFLATLSTFYRLYNPKVSKIADKHYKGIYYQYPALRKKLWEYYFIKIEK